MVGPGKRALEFLVEAVLVPLVATLAIEIGRGAGERANLRQCECGHPKADHGGEPGRNRKVCRDTCTCKRFVRATP